MTYILVLNTSWLNMFCILYRKRILLVHCISGAKVFSLRPLFMASTSVIYYMEIRACIYSRIVPDKAMLLMKFQGYWRMQTWQCLSPISSSLKSWECRDAASCIQIRSLMCWSSRLCDFLSGNDGGHFLLAESCPNFFRRSLLLTPFELQVAPKRTSKPPGCFWDTKPHLTVTTLKRWASN